MVIDVVAATPLKTALLWFAEVEIRISTVDVTNAEQASA